MPKNGDKLLKISGQTWNIRWHKKFCRRTWHISSKNRKFSIMRVQNESKIIEVKFFDIKNSYSFAFLAKWNGPAVEWRRFFRDEEGVLEPPLFSSLVLESSCTMFEYRRFKALRLRLDLDCRGIPVAVASDVLLGAGDKSDSLCSECLTVKLRVWYWTSIKLDLQIEQNL